MAKRFRRTLYADLSGLDSDDDSSFYDDSSDQESTSEGDDDGAPEASKCPVCFEPYGESPNLPKMLKCGHTLCDGCAGRIIARGMIKCPLCQASMRARQPSDLATNYALKDLIEETAKTDEAHAAELAQWEEWRTQQAASAADRDDQTTQTATALVVCESCETRIAQSEAYACLDGSCTTAVEHQLTAVEHTELEEAATQSIAYTWRATKRMCAGCICRSHLSHDVVEYSRVPSELLANLTLVSIYQKMQSLHLSDYGALHPFRKVADEVNERFNKEFAKLTQSENAFTTEEWDKLVKSLQDIVDHIQKFITSSTSMETIQAQILAKFKNGAE